MRSMSVSQIVSMFLGELPGAVARQQPRSEFHRNLVISRNAPSESIWLNVDFTLRTAPTFIKSRARNTIIITPTIIISPKRVIFVGTRISIRFQLTLIGFQTYISGIIIAGVSQDGDRSFKGGERGGGRGGGVLY